MKNTNPRREGLRTVPGLEGFDAKQFAQLASSVDDCRVPAGWVLMAEGEVGRQAFVVVEGEAEVRVCGSVVATIGPGDIVGEIAMLNHIPRSATVTASTPMRLLVTGPGAWRDFVENPAVSRMTARQLPQRLRRIETALEVAQ